MFVCSKVSYGLDDAVRWVWAYVQGNNCFVVVHFNKHKWCHWTYAQTHQTASSKPNKPLLNKDKGIYIYIFCFWFVEWCQSLQSLKQMCVSIMLFSLVVLLLSFKALVLIRVSTISMFVSCKIIEYICVIMEIVGLFNDNLPKTTILSDKCRESCYLFSGDNSLIDHRLNNNQISHGSRLELLRPFFNWFLMDCDQTSYESSLEILRPFFNWFLTDG